MVKSELGGAGRWGGRLGADEGTPASQPVSIIFKWIWGSKYVTIDVKVPVLKFWQVTNIKSNVLKAKLNTFVSDSGL